MLLVAATVPLVFPWPCRPASAFLSAARV